MEKLEITIEIYGYENDGLEFCQERENELVLVLRLYLKTFGLPKKGQVFYDGNIGVELFNTVFSRTETTDNLCADFTFIAH